eukprot:gene9360-1571_t
MEIDPTMKDEPLFVRFKIQISQTRLNLPEKEQPLTLYNSFINSAVKIQLELTTELSEQQENSLISLYSKKLLTLINGMLKNSYEASQSYSRRRGYGGIDLEENVEIKENSIDQEEFINLEKNNKDEKEWEEYYTIKNFNFYGRGLFITFIHTLENEYLEVLKRKKLSENIKKNLKGYQSSFEKSMRKINVLYTLIDVGLIAYEKLEKNKGLTPFNDDIEISDYPQVTKLYIVDFMKEIGTQYVWRLGVFFSLLVSGTASHSYALTTNWKDTNFVTSNIYYFLNFDEAAKNTTNFFSEVDAGKGKALWDFHDKPFVKAGIYLSFPKINTSVTFSIPRNDLYLKENDEIFLMDGNKQVVYKTNEISKNNEIFEKTIQNLENTKIFVNKIEEQSQETKTKIKVELKEIIKNEVKVELKEEKIVSNIVSNDNGVSIEKFIKMAKMIPKQLGDFESPDVAARLLSPYKIDNLLKIETKSDFPTFKVLENWFASFIQPEVKVDEEKKGSVIFHIHGGGFVAMSTFGHESYLRRWSSHTGLPIISIDYRKAPEFKFPVSHEECFLAYKWFLKVGHIFLKTKIKNIIVSGDSAGGNLSLALTLRCIVEGVKPPDAIAISYPATYLTTSPSPGRLCSLIDPMVNFSFLKMCSESYLKHGEEGYDGKQNPFISPAVAPNEVLKLFPPTYINIGTLDPLFDDGVYMAQRINKNNGGKVKLDIFDGLGHGYLNMSDFLNEGEVGY